MSGKTPRKPRTPKHGNGMLLSGGTNKGGPGRPPSIIRMRSRALYERWLEWAEGAVGTGQLDPEVMNVIGNTAGRYGLGTTITETDHDGKTTEKVIRVIREDRPLRRDDG